MILAGGAGRRFGGLPKGLEIVGGTRIIDRAASALLQVTAELLLAANDQDAVNWLDDVLILSDNYAESGGLAGVEAALSHGRDVLVVAWDMPFVTPPLLEALVTVARESLPDAVVPESNSPYGFEPFCAFYSVRILSKLTSFLAEGGGAAHDFVLQLPGLRRLPAKTVARFGDPGRLFFSVNTPDDLARARSMVLTK